MLHKKKDLSARVLIIDDDRTLRLLIREVLENEGFLVEEATDGPEGLALFESTRPDLIILDVMMPTMDGYEVCRILRASIHGELVPILVVTGLEDLDSIKHAFDVGATDFIIKPINWFILTQRLRYMLRASRAEEHIRELAYYDALTTLPNQRLFREHLIHAVAHARRHNRLVAVLFLDLDNFKRVNDTLGHHAGDEILRSFGERLRTSVRKYDCIGLEPGETDKVTMSRLGGDEFAVMISDIRTPAEAEVVARRIIDALTEPFDLVGQEVFISTSIGIGISPQDGSDLDTLLRNADAAMYKAKEMGKNTFQFYDEAMASGPASSLIMANGLRRALDRNEFELFFQPLVDIETKRTYAVEALLRWNRPGIGAVLPMDFIPLAEESGLILPIGEWVLRQACAQGYQWHAAGHLIRIAVNISARQFRNPSLANSVIGALEDSGFDPRYLDLELTESSLMGDTQLTLDILKKLTTIGVSFAIDDFGTGYSSLSYLKRFPINTLKVDRSFVTELGNDSDDTAIVSAIVQLAHSLKLTVVAEGVESQMQFDTLRTIGCDALQGYLFGQPTTAATMGDWLGVTGKK